MIPTKALRNAAMELLADDVATLAPVAGNKLVLYINDMTPSENSELADFTPATFTGSTPIVVEPLTQPEGYVPGSGDSRIALSPPAGGFRWECTAGTGLPQTVYGYYLTDTTGADYLAAQRFTDPIVIANVGDAIEVTNAWLTLLANSIS